MRSLCLLLLAGTCGGVFSVAQQAPATPVQQGLEALHSHRPQQALGFFQQAIAADPKSAPANLLAASAELALYDGKAAVGYAERAAQLDPGDWKIHTTLVTAYAMAGDTAHRDAERAYLRKAHADPALADAHGTEGFLLDMFRVKDYRVDVVEYFEPIGRYNTYFRFLVRNAEGQRVWTIEVDSDSLNQASWAARYPREAKQGQRQFQIESPPGDNEVDYATFSGAPSYDYAKAKVVKILDAQAGPFPGQTAAQ